MSPQCRNAAINAPKPMKAPPVARLKARITGARRRPAARRLPPAA
jgi:hypothetical protein